MKLRITLLVAVLFLLLAPARPAFAACSNPTANAGTMIYNGDYRVVEYCNGGSWIRTSQVGAGDTTTGLVGWWKLDDGSGTSAADSSGNSNTGTLDNSPVWTTSGMNGGALTFPGSGAGQDVRAGNPASLQITGSITLTAWINAASINPSDADDGIIDKTNFPSNAGYQLKGSQDCTGVSPQDNLVLTIGSGSVFVERCSNTVFQTNRWYFVAGVYNATAQTMHVYVNGVLDDGTLLSGPVPSSMANNTANFLVGDISTDGGGNQVFHGTIDDPRVYNRALNAADIKTLYTSTGGSYPTGFSFAPAQSSGTACALAGKGVLYCWGQNSNGEAGLGNTTQYTTPQQLGAAPNLWTSISQGDGGYNSSACGIDAGNLWCWGQNQYGEAGLGNTTQYTTPQQVTSPATTWRAVSTGGYDTCAITTAGKLYCWGLNGHGEAGLGNITQYMTPQQVGTDTTWTAISNLATSTCGIDAGKLYCWGQDNQGELGCGGCGEQHSPVQVGSDTSWTAISQGLMSTCGIDAGTLWCWGNGNNGVLGLGNTTQYTTPQRVGADTNWTAVSINNDNSKDPGTCGIDAGRLYCWGYNQYGELGLGNTTQYTTPQQVGTDATWTAVSYGGFDTCGIDNRRLYCWGNNHWGEDGTGNGTQYTTPQLVALDGGGCAGPVGYAGDVQYNNGSNHVLQFCDGVVWRPMGKVPGAGGAGCSGPSGNEGDMRYNGDKNVMQYCDGTNWQAAGGGPIVGPTTGLVGWWKLDETSGTSAADSSGTGNTGTLFNTPVWTAGGKDNGSLGFTYTSSQYVDVGIGASLQLTSVGTVAAWVKFGDQTPSGSWTIIAGNYDNNVDKNGYSLFTWANNLAIEIADGSGGISARSPATYSDNNWHHAVGTWDGSNLNMYVDGVLVASVAQTRNAVSNLYHINIGRDTHDANAYFNGLIDDVRIYNRALSAAEVLRLYKSTGG